MDSTIVRWCRKACQKFAYLKMGCYYTPNQDCFYLHINGHPVMNFSSRNFYEIEPAYRWHKMLLPLITVGMFNNVGDKNNTNDFKIGIRIA